MPEQTDYLVVGAGLGGLAFADALIAETDAEVTIVDRQPAPGGHWLNAYPFIRLHSPSAYYGVNSMVLGNDRIDEAGENAGYYERARGEEVRDYLTDAASRLTQTGRVRLLTEHEHLGRGGEGEQIRDLRTAEVREVAVRRKVVDARYLEASIPATHRPSFEVESGVRFVPVNELPAAAGSSARYTVLGSGKTAVDACTWLLDNDVDPEQIRWVRPRDAWFHDRRHFQPLTLVGEAMTGLSLDVEAGAQASDVGELFSRLEASGRLSRIDTSHPATMYRGTMLSSGELDSLRQIEDVVRLGRVRRIEADRIVLEQGEVETGSDELHVDCTAQGVRKTPAVPIFQTDRIVLQPVRYNSPPFNSALVAYVEAHRSDDEEKNALCPPNPYASCIEDWPAMMRRTWLSERLWLAEPDLSAWIAESRLNLLAALPEHVTEPPVREAVERFVTNVDAAIERTKELDGSGSTELGEAAAAAGD